MIDDFLNYRFFSFVLETTWKCSIEKHIILIDQIKNLLPFTILLFCHNGSTLFKRLGIVFLFFIIDVGMIRKFFYLTAYLI